MFNIFRIFNNQPSYNDPELICKLLRKQSKLPLLLEDLRYILKKFQPQITLFNLASALQMWGLETLHINITPSDLKSLALPAISQLYDDKGIYYILITQVHEYQIEYFLSSNFKIIEPISSFSEKWNGEVLLYEYNYINTLVTKGNVINSNAALTFAICLLLSPFILMASLHYIALLVTSILGIFVTIGIMMKELGSSTLFLSKICSIIPKSNCDTNHSSNRNLFSTTGLFYFLFVLTFTMNMIYYNNYNTRILLHVIILIASLVSVGLIIIQIWRQKSVCVLCIITHLIVLTQFVCVFNHISLLFNNVTVSTLYSVVLFAFCSLVASLLIKKLIHKNVIIRELSTNIKFLKYDNNIFRSTIGINKSIPIPSINVISEIPGWNHEIILLISFHCGECLNALKLFKDKLINGSIFKLKLKFMMPNDDKFEFKVAEYIIKVQMQYDLITTISALENWLEYKNLDLVKSSFPIDSSISVDEIKDIIIAYRQWVQSINIDKVYTPMILINNSIVPAIYSLEDIRYHLNYSLQV